MRHGESRGTMAVVGAPVQFPHQVGHARIGERKAVVVPQLRAPQPEQRRRLGAHGVAASPHGARRLHGLLVHLEEGERLATITDRPVLTGCRSPRGDDATAREVERLPRAHLAHLQFAGTTLGREIVLELERAHARRVVRSGGKARVQAHRIAGVLHDLTAKDQPRRAAAADDKRRIRGTRHGCASRLLRVSLADAAHQRGEGGARHDRSRRGGRLWLEHRPVFLNFNARRGPGFGTFTESLT
eukprot:5113738-Prymnesium_polylepis.1